MIIDLRSVNSGANLECDLCIVGSGAAGLAIASELRLSGLRILVLESGGMDHEPPTQALYDVEISGLPHPGSTQGRFRVCGGSTTMWGGQALPLTPQDFEARAWVAHSGWPISFDEVNAYYSRAQNFLLVDQRGVGEDLLTYLNTKAPEFDSHQLWYHFSKWSPAPSVRERHLPDFRHSKNCTLMLHANVTDIRLTEGLDRVELMLVRSLDGHKATVRARSFILCAGGIETARLLLANNQQRSQGLGNENDIVGRFFQDHPSATIGSLKAGDSRRAQNYLNVFHKRGLKYSVRCTATRQWQRENRVLNISMGTSFVPQGPALQDVKDLYAASRTARVGMVDLQKLLRVMRHPSGAISPAWHFLVHGRSFVPEAQMRINVTSEQEPNPESRISLSEERDALGMRKANVRWRLTNLTGYTIRKFAKLLCQQFRKARIGEIALDPWVQQDSSDWTDHITDQFHHIGTTRMHDSPREGVVDRDCRVHGISNLYIASSAVFPTSGHSNPTLTIIALAMRLADRLRAELL